MLQPDKVVLHRLLYRFPRDRIGRPASCGVGSLEFHLLACDRLAT
jgi:hypothetical protein